MKIAVTGGNGRVGQAVIQWALAQGHTVVSIDRTPPDQTNAQASLTYTQADLTDYTAFTQALQGCTALIHLAAIPSPRHVADHEVHNNNVVASYNALSAAAYLGINRVCQASSINAIGAVYSRWPRYDYLPVDEHHPTYNEDPYSLSKWICEQQADAITRRYESMTVASLRLHWAVPARADAAPWQGDLHELLAKQLWGYTCLRAAARAFLRALTADFSGHEVFYVVAPDTMVDTPSVVLKEHFFPDVPLRGSLCGNQGFFNCAKAERLLGWRHDEEEA